MAAAVQVIFDQAFRPGREPRSDAYKAGVLAALRSRLEGIPFPAQYRAGSSDRDAYLAGADEGRALAAASKEARA